MVNLFFTYSHELSFLKAVFPYLLMSPKLLKAFQFNSDQYIHNF